ncbi:hypothetical protein OZX68_01160 [Streptococcaceae bacterium ESL0729]|nr:hypothetical protein OZX68_01160 [Streptococcaceae bacterium ESL0729]
MGKVLFDEKFGFLLKKRVILEDESITIKKNKFNLDDIACVYYKPYDPSLLDGVVYFSKDGNDQTTRSSFGATVISFTQGEIKKVEDLLNLLTSLNVEVIKRESKPVVTPAVPKENVKKNIISCPACHSINVSFMGNDRKSFSVGKAVAGAALTSGVGVLAGFAGKKGKNQWHCNNCGNTFETKK